MTLKEVKQYLRVDYTDDDSIIELMIDAVIDEMKELIPTFNEAAPTNRQKLLIYAYVKELYDHRDTTASRTADNIRYAVRSMLTKEMLRGQYGSGKN